MNEQMESEFVRHGIHSTIRSSCIHLLDENLELIRFRFYLNPMSDDVSWIRPRRSLPLSVSPISVPPW
jgi:hypothetical protein